MTVKRFTVEQIVSIVKQAELRIPAAEIVRQVGVSEQKFRRWESNMLACIWTKLRNRGNSKRKMLDSKSRSRR